MSCQSVRSSRSALRPFHNALVAALALAANSAFANPNVPSGAPDVSVDFPAGYACSNFALRLEIWDGKGQYRELKARNGYTRLAFAGTGSAWRMTNLSTGKFMTTQNNGASALYDTHEVDGTLKVKVNGHSLLIWFPTDLPAGPSSHMVSGQVVYEVDVTGVGSKLSTKGHATDVCANLS